MRQLVLLLAFAACGNQAEKVLGDKKPAEPPDRAQPDPKPAEPVAKPDQPPDEEPEGPPPTELPPAPTEGGGTCTVIGTAGREFKQVSGGGPSAANVFQWQTPEERKAKKYKDEGYRAMKLRFGWGPADGAAGMQKNVDLVRTVRQVVGDGVDIMADAYMGWNLDYARRMLPLLEPFNLRWLEEPVIPDDLQGYVALKSLGRIPIAGGEHGFTQYEFRDLLEARAVDYIQFDTNRVGGITQARKISAMAESFAVPVVPHAGQMHNYHIVMASLNSPMAEYFPRVDVEVGNELFWYIFDGEPVAKNGAIDLRDDVPGLGLKINEGALGKFTVIE